MMRVLLSLMVTGFLCITSVALLSASEGHDGGKVRCFSCHVTLPLENRPVVFHEDIAAICSGCHESFPCKPDGENSYFNHPVNVAPSFAIPDDMPLDKEKKMSCMTCHVFHYKKKAGEDLFPSLLRRSPGVQLCFTCHGRMR